MVNKVFIAGAGGRIFSCMVRALATHGQLGQLVGVSASGPKNLEEMAEKLDHDSTHRRFPLQVRSRPSDDNESLGYLTFEDDVVGKENGGAYYEVPVYAQPDPSKLPLAELGVDVAVDATGKFLTAESASEFLDAGAKKILMTAPSKDDTPLVIYGINSEVDTGLAIVSLASCTTNCAAPIVVALEEAYGMPENIFLNTTHAVTNSQKLLDGNSGKLSNSFSGLNNIIVTDTGATKSLQKMFPVIKATTGISCRVPVATGSILSLVMEYHCEKQLTKEGVIEALENFHDKSILRVSHRQTMISSYVIGRQETCIVAPGQIEVIGNIVRVVAGYDNEYAYAYRASQAALYCPLPKE
jgi:glyceraldehyde 3-phosphate dehydrogenase